MKTSPSKPLTILFDANPLMTSLTGVGYYTAGLVESLAKADSNVRMVGYYYNFLGRKQPPQTPTAKNISYRPIYHAPGPLVNLLRRNGLELPVELLTLCRADFILYPNFLGLPSLFKTPNAPVIHDLMFHDHPEWGSDKNIRDLNRFVPRTLGRSSFAITVSRFTSDRLTASYGYPDEKILTTFIPPVAAYTLSRPKARRLIDKLGLDKPYMLFVGTLEPRKNLPNLLDAYTLLPKKLRDSYALVLAGKMDWKYQETKSKLETLHGQGYDIRYVGYVDNDTRAALYQNARLMVLASYYEGFGMQLLEALQYGIPSVVSDIPVFREVGGEGRFYFDHLNPQNIADSLTKCLETAPPVASQLQAYVRQQPQWPEIASAVLQQIHTTIRGGPSR